MGNQSDVIAGGAVVQVGTEDSNYNAGLDRAERRLKAFAQAAVAMGSRVTGFGVSLGAGLLAAGSSFASTGSKLESLQSQMVGLKEGSTELEKLRKEASRLQNILGGESVSAAVKLSKSLSGLKDSVSSVVVKFAAALAPAITSTVDYFREAVDSVGAFIQRNRALAPQAAIVAGAITAAGVAIGALGAAFYVAGPIIRLSMIAATAATMAFGMAVGVVNTTVAIGSAVLKVLAGVVTASAAAFRALSLVTISFSVAMTAANMATKVIAFTLGTMYAAVKAVTISLALTAATARLASAGYKGLAASITVARQSLLAFKVASAAASAISFTGLLTAGIGLAAAFFMWTDAGKQMGAAIVGVFGRLQDAAGSALSAIINQGASLIPSLKGYFGEVSAMAQQVFGQVADVAKRAFTAASKLFKDLLGVAKVTFSGISDAISAGNIELATKILWTGLKIAWVKGGDAIKATWDTSMVYIEAALDQLMTNLKMIWDVGLAYMEGAIDTFAKKVQGGLQPIQNWLAEFIAKRIGVDVNVLKADQKARDENQKIDADKRVNDRVNRIANAGVDPKSKEREDARQARLDKVGKESPAMAALVEELTQLRLQAAKEKAKALTDAADRGKPGSDAGKQIALTMNTTAAQARGSAGAASSIAKSINAGGGIQEKILKSHMEVAAHAKKHSEYLKTLAGKPPVKVEEYS